MRYRMRRNRPIDGCSDRDPTSAAAATTSATSAIHRDHVVDGQRAPRERPGLVERTAHRRVLEVHAALDNDHRCAAAAERGETIETGVDMTSAHGQAITSSTSAR